MQWTPHRHESLELQLAGETFDNVEGPEGQTICWVRTNASLCQSVYVSVP